MGSGSKTGSLASGTIKAMDRIVDVNSIPVSDKDVCKTLIVDALKQFGVVTMIIERPVAAEAIETMERALSGSLQEPSVALASDVKSILLRYNEKLKSGYGNRKPANILRQPGSSSPEHGHVRISEKEHSEMLIGMDNESNMRHLHKVPPKKDSRYPRRKKKPKKRM